MTEQQDRVEFYRWALSERKGFETFEYRTETLLVQVWRSKGGDSSWRCGLFTESVAADVGKTYANLEAAKRAAIKEAQKWLMRDVRKFGRILNRGEK